MKNLVTESHILNSIEFAQRLQSNLHPAILNFEGMSTAFIRHLFNNIANSGDEVNYLEIGTWCGATFCSTLFNNNVKGIVIDNFSEFDNMAWVEFETKVLRDKLWRYKGFTHPKNGLFYQIGKTEGLNNRNFNFVFLEKNCFEVNLALFKNKIDFFFYDGNHSEENQYKAYTYYNSILADRFVTIIDDYSDEKIVAATLKAFKDLNYKIILEKRLYGGNTTDVNDEKSWWNGIGLYILEK